jgi:GT2 family glycosyltransferase
VRRLLYRRWARAQSVGPACRDTIRRQIAARDLCTPVSLLLWAADATATRLEATIASVREQIYPHWELQVVAAPAVTEELERGMYARGNSDPRIRITGAVPPGLDGVNAVLKQCSGEFFALLHPGDRLSELALFFIADALACGDVDLAYCDEDRLRDGRGSFDPFFKPQWDPELILGRDYFNGLGIYRRRLAIECGGFQSTLEDAGAWDLLLRCVERVPMQRIRHIPRVLCHRAGGVANPNTEASVAAVGRHLARKGETATVLPHPRLAGMCKTKFLLVGDPPLVSIVIPTRDRRDLLEPCVRSILERTHYSRFELIIVDNQSTDPRTLAYLSGLGASGAARILRYDKPFNWSAINNFAVRSATGELIALLNNDIEVLTGSWLADMAALAVRPGVGAVGAMLVFPDRSVQHAGIVLGLTGLAGHPHRAISSDAPGYQGRLQLLQNYSAVTGACLVVQKARYLKVGGVDEELAVAYNDVDFCLKLRQKGYRNVWTPDAVLLHKESATRGYEDNPAKKARLAREAARVSQKWTNWIEDDPCYNANLSLIREDFRVAWPPRLKGPCDT